MGYIFVFLLVVSTKLDFINRPTRLNKVRSLDLRSFSPGGSGGSASLPLRRRFKASIETCCCCGGCCFLLAGVLGSVVSWHFPTGGFLRTKYVGFWVSPPISLRVLGSLTDVFAKTDGGQTYRGVTCTGGGNIGSFRLSVSRLMT
jgi:hypothetical protein